MKAVNIYTEGSPNPSSLKFVVDFLIVENISFDFPDIEGTTYAPLAKALFQEFSFVKRVFIAANFITLTKDSTVEWYEVKNKVSEYIKNWFREEKPVFEEGIKKQVAKEDLTQNAKISTSEHTTIVEQIKSILEDYVRPAVENDGGAISFHSFDEGVVKVILQGSCSGCPSSTVTLKHGIQNLLTKMIPQVKEVEAINA